MQLRQCLSSSIIDVANNRSQYTRLRLAQSFPIPSSSSHMTIDNGSTVRLSLTSKQTSNSFRVKKLFCTTIFKGRQGKSKGAEDQRNLQGGDPDRFLRLARLRNYPLPDLNLPDPCCTLRTSNEVIAVAVERGRRSSSLVRGIRTKDDRLIDEELLG